VPVDDGPPNEAAHERAGATQFLRWSARRGGDGPIVVALAGELDMAAAGEVSCELGHAVDAGADVVVDMTELTFVDSSGLGALLHGHNAARARGHSLRLRHLQRAVARTMAVSGLDKVFAIED